MASRALLPSAMGAVVLLLLCYRGNLTNLLMCYRGSFTGLVLLRYRH